MNADIERLIALQRIDSAVRDGEDRIAREPDRARELDARLEVARERLAEAKAALAVNQEARREAEKELGIHQGRLSKYRDQLMAVKTNVEYQAMQKEIEFAQTEVRTQEERILLRMLEADELTAAVTRAEAELAAEQKAVEADRQTLAAEVAAIRQALAHLADQRTALVAALDQAVFATFDRVSAKRQGVGVAEARDGICTVCHVRLRPQIFNTVRRNEDIIQCDSCQRILYFVPGAAEAAAAAPPSP